MTAVTSERVPTAAENRLRNVRSTLAGQETVLVVILVGLVFIIGAINARFWAPNNISSILLNSSYIAIAAIGEGMIIISGNIDISVASMLGVLATISGTLSVALPKAGAPIWLTLIVAWGAPLVVGPLIGAVTGFFVAFLKIPAIVMTLAMLSILQGGLILATGGAWIYNMPPEYQLSQQHLLGLPVPVYFMIALTIIVGLWLRYAPAGRAIYALGGNAEAAGLSGISQRTVIMRVFMLNGFMVGIASVLFATQFSSIQSTVPQPLLITVITAAVVGGISIIGGTGTVIGSTLATILLFTISSGLIFINISAYWLPAVQGILILTTVLIDLLRRRRQMIDIRG